MPRSHPEPGSQESSTNWREFFERYSKKWTARAVVILLVFALFVHVAHHFRILEWIKPEAATATLDTAVFFMLFLLLEEFFANDEKLDRFSSESRSKQNLTVEKLDDLVRQVESGAGITGYSEHAVFTAKWQSLLHKFNAVTLVGELPIDYIRDVGDVIDKERQAPGSVKDKTISIYRSLNTDSKDKVNQLIEMSAASRPGLVKLYHMYGFEWGSWVMGQNQAAEDSEILLNYANAERGVLEGLHLSGRAARSFIKAVAPHFNQVGLPGVSYPPIELASREQIEFIVEEKVDYQKKITEMVREGVPIEGTERICGAMIQLVQNTKTYLDVTHLCINEGAIERTRDVVFKDWLAANYTAVSRGVHIRRILIVERAHYGHATLVQLKAEMRSHNVEVFLCPLDGLKQNLQQDFSIYDGQHLVYMDRGRVFWTGTAQPLARRTENAEKIQDFKLVFDSLMRRIESDPV